MPLGPTELIIILVIVLLLFGAKRLPNLGRDLGTGMREFKDSVTGGSSDDDDAEDETPALEPGEGTPAPPLTASQGEPVQEPADDLLRKPQAPPHRDAD